MPPPRRPRDRLARALRATADRLSVPGPPGAPGPADDVPRPPGQPPEHWRRLVAAHAPGLLRDLPPHPSPVEHGPLTGPSANGGSNQTRVRRSPAGRRAVGRLWRGWKALLTGRFGTSRSRTRFPHEAGPGSPPRSWYERAPIGAVSYQDPQSVPVGGTGVPAAGSREPVRVCAHCGGTSRDGGGGWGSSPLGRVASLAAEAGGGLPGSAGPDIASNRADAGSTRVASTWTGPESGSARPGSEPAGAGFSTGYKAGLDAASAPALSPACRCVTGSRGPAGSPGRPTTAGDADATGSADTPGRARTPGAAPRSDTAGSTDAAGSAGTACTTGGTETTGSRATDRAGSPGTPTPGGPDRQSPPTRWPGLGADRADALTRRARADRSRERHRADDLGTEPSPARDDVLPLLFAAASPHGRQRRAGRGGTGDGSVDHHPGRAAGSPYPDGRDPGGESRARQGQRPARPTSGSPWPALPDDAGPARTPNPAGAGRATGGGAHADPWPALPGEPVWWSPATRATFWGDTARLDREQAGD